jgi:hypothetical protein
MVVTLAWGGAGYSLPPLKQKLLNQIAHDHALMQADKVGLEQQIRNATTLAELDKIAEIVQEIGWTNRYADGMRGGKKSLLDYKKFVTSLIDRCNLPETDRTALKRHIDEAFDYETVELYENYVKLHVHDR